MFIFWSTVKPVDNPLQLTFNLHPLFLWCSFLFALSVFFYKWQFFFSRWWKPTKNPKHICCSWSLMMVKRYATMFLLFLHVEGIWHDYWQRTLFLNLCLTGGFCLAVTSCRCYTAFLTSRPFLNPQVPVFGHLNFKSLKFTENKQRISFIAHTKCTMQH